MRRSWALLAVLTLVLGACERGLAPVRSLPYASLSPADGPDAAATRAVVVDFVNAYAASVDDGGVALMSVLSPALVPSLAEWPHWLSVQTAAFDGTITARGSVELVGPATPAPLSEDLPESGAFIHSVSVRASVTFTFDPVDADPFDVTRSLDGRMLMGLTDGGRWVVLNFTRDGRSLAGQFQAFSLVPVESAGMRLSPVVLQSDGRIWQFGIRIVNASGEELFVDLGRTELIDSSGDHDAGPAAETTFRGIAPGTTAEGFINFPALQTQAGVTMQVTLVGGERPIVVQVRIGDVIDPLALVPAPFDPLDPQPTPAETASPSSS